MNCVLLCKSLSLFDIIPYTIVIAREKRKTAGRGGEGGGRGEGAGTDERQGEERGETSEGGASARMREWEERNVITV